MPRENTPVQLGARQQRLVAALVDEFTPGEYQYLVGAADLGQSVGNHQRGAAFQNFVDGALDGVFGGAVDRARRVVEDEDARVGEEGACDG